ncbi:hypothetical protein AYI69_g3127, partial [Smittium culicis]
MSEIGLEIDDKDTQTVVTADGSMHNKIGSITSLPITIEDYIFPCDTLVLELSKPLLILGTDWFSRYNAVIDLKSKELVLEKPEKEIEDTITKFQDIFATDIKELTQTKVTEHFIDTGDAQP